MAETADMLEENPSVIEQIYDILRQNAPDYDVQKIYQLLLKKHTGQLNIGAVLCVFRS